MRKLIRRFKNNKHSIIIDNYYQIKKQQLFKFNSYLKSDKTLTKNHSFFLSLLFESFVFYSIDLFGHRLLVLPNHYVPYKRGFQTNDTN